jgi:hypothetical protein
VSLGGVPVALYDSLENFELGIDFSRQPEEIVAAMERVFQERVDSGDWTRRDCGGHRTASPNDTEETRGQHH